jgi:ELWxxDGT repeat protein
LCATTAVLFFAAFSKLRGTELMTLTHVGVQEAPQRSILEIVSGPSGSDPRDIIAFGSNRALFSARTAPTGRELFVPDGTQVGPAPVKDICAGPGDSMPSFFAEFAEKVFFQADDCAVGVELWVTDGTLDGTRLLKDIHGGSAGSFPSYIAQCLSLHKHVLLFLAADGSRHERFEDRTRQ